MADGKVSEQIEMGVLTRNAVARRGWTPGALIALGLSALWIVGCGVFFLVADNGLSGASASNMLVTLLAVFLPVAIIWLAATAASSAQSMREETVRLQATIDAMRQSYLTQSQVQPDRAPEVEAKLRELEEAQRQTEQAMATFTTTRTLPRAEPLPEPKPRLPQGPFEAQAALAFDPQPVDTAPPLSLDDFIRALHFPENAEDEAGFAALRRALKDRKTARLVQASQDVLTLLAQDGIYMDDLRPDRARPEIWRRFAAGARGREVAALGGIRDRSSLALTAGRMKADPIFRDAAHHFLRRFDEIFSDFADSASDEDIARMGDTRTARAFMLLGRVTGTFN
ncbi:hypothetical protein [Maritimibacter sp. DP1N21-5]|uniref:hypothetical protein n=1 Tax=Maritimibacter sp. DP1N21-5 TaxID=2836867 RepID=UPI001C480EA2|nr:hypothetical protein [Maritimibacter sp. DP1N21-5]MBV7407959.1 hypothetical protein [Maritimibacter sp. DP1N21-5]